MRPNQQKRIKLGPAAPTDNPAADAVGLVSTQCEPMEEAVKAVLDVKGKSDVRKDEQKRKRRRQRKRISLMLPLLMVRLMRWRWMGKKR